MGSGLEQESSRVNLEDGKVAGFARFDDNEIMTSQEKIAAIQKIVTNHQENLRAKQSANIKAGLEPLVIEAMNNAFIADLEVVFAIPAAQSSAG